MNRGASMPYTIQLAEHYSDEDIYERYRHCKDVLERAHWQVVWLKSQGRATDEIRAATGYSAHWIRTLIHRYNEEGESGLKDRRRAHPGATPLLCSEDQAKLERLLEKGKAPDGGPWNGPKVARWMEEKTGREHVLGSARLGLPRALGLLGADAAPASRES